MRMWKLFFSIALRLKKNWSDLGFTVLLLLFAHTSYSLREATIKVKCHFQRRRKIVTNQWSGAERQNEYILS